MPTQKRYKTKYPGVVYIEGTATGTGKPERIYYILYRKKGRQIHEKAGRQFQNDMTASRAAGMRANRIAGKEPTNKERRQAIEKAKKAQQGKWTIDRLWMKYSATRKHNKALATDAGRYKNHIKPVFGPLEPHEIDALSVDRLRITLSKKLKPQTILNILTLFLSIVNFGINRGLSKPLSFKVKKPKVDNITTEDLTPIQLKRLLKAIDEDGHLHAGPMMLLALYSGMRRGELFKLRWKDINFDRGFIELVDPKGGPDQRIPLNLAARKLLQNHIRTGSDYVFPGRNGNQRTSIYEPVCRLKRKAGLPKGFRPLHGLRHTYASMLASSGEVDLYTLSKLLTHKDVKMTQRYAHLRDDALKKASGVASDIMAEIAK